MIPLSALPMKFKAEHVDPVAGKAPSTSSLCQFMAEQEVVWHSFPTLLKPGELKDACNK